MGKNQKGEGGAPGKGGKGFKAEDIALWKAVTKDAAPLHPDYVFANPPEEGERAKPMPKTSGDVRIGGLAPPSPRPRARGHDLDKNTLDKLRKGKMQIEARLDLHGYTQDAAHKAIVHFIDAAHARGQRCVLIITGKGKASDRTAQEEGDWTIPAPGVLKRRLSTWLSDPAIRDKVLQHVEAQPKDGGSGAFYIYLRRER